MKRPAFEELDFAVTPLGELSLRRRVIRSLDGLEVFEVKLGGAFLMSSLVNDAEVALATLSLPLLADTACDVLVGGLGLGCTAAAALDHGHVRQVTVVEALPSVMDWHRRGLLPLSARLTGDARCHLCHGDFFAAMRSRVATVGDVAAGAIDDVGEHPDRSAAGRFHAILLDIDHSPCCLLDAAHAPFYTADGLRGLIRHLHPGGVFALWSADPLAQGFQACLEEVFADLQVHPTPFFNPLLNEQDVNYVVVARAA